MDFNCGQYTSTIAYHNINEPKKKENMKNIVSQFYSRNRVRDTLETYIKTTNKQYDFVISTRFDFVAPITLDLHSLKPNILYTSNVNGTRQFIPDFFVISNVNDFLNFHNVYSNLPHIIHP
jgi:hypothetical protein